MLLARLITALILIPATLAILYFSSALTFMFITGFIVLIGAWEWAGLMRIKSPVLKVGYLLIIFIGLAGAYVGSQMLLLKIAVAWWFLALVLLLSYSRFNAWGKNKFLLGLMGILVLVPCWSAVNFVRLRPEGFYILVFLLVLIWGADSAAYFAGKKWGKCALCPAISPGKTWEGTIAGLLSVIPITIITFLLAKTPMALWPAGFILGFVTVFFSIVGDLFESVIKRQAGVKDSGVLLPGHGGLLDRIDSLTAAAPVFALTAWMISIYYQ